MIKHYVKVALRLIKRSFLFSSINMLGFVFGMAAAFLIYLWVVDELTYDDCFPEVNRVYRTIEVKREPSGEIKESPSTVRSLTKVFREDFPQVEEATAIKYGELHTFETESHKKISGHGLYVDSAFFRIFPFPVLEGNPEYISNNPDNVVLSELTAQKMFGKKPAVGQKLTYSGYGRERIYNVVAVVKIPSKSHIRFDIVYPMEAYGMGMMGHNWDHFRESIHVYVKMKAGDEGKMYQQELKSMSRRLVSLGKSELCCVFNQSKIFI